MGKRVLFIIVGVIIVAVAITVTAASRRIPAHADAPQAQHPTATSGKTADLDGHGEVVTTDLFRNIAKRENPVVVAITTESRVKTPEMGQGEQDLLQRFFGMQPQQMPRDQIEHALGSGFIISKDGEILTNNHVVQGAEQIRVALLGDDQKTYPAKVVGRDPLTDSALIRIENAPASLPAATLGDSDAVEPGDWVMAIGNPFQLGHTVTVGVISYKGRPFQVANGRWENMLQTDASINPGNSGGPLVDTAGNVIGIDSAILSSSGGEEGGNIGIGFAVPINTVKNLLPQLRTGTVKRGQLGVFVLNAPVTAEDAKSLGLPKAAGAIISTVEQGSPAERAGLRPGDVVVEYNGKPVTDANQLTEMVVNTPAGTQVPIVFYRDGRQQTATATIQELTLENNGQQNGSGGGGVAKGFGLSLGNVTPDIAQQLSLPAGVQGALVENVDPGSPASQVLQRGDVILQVNHQAVHSASDAAQALDAIRSGQTAFLLLWRQGSRAFVEVRKD